MILKALVLFVLAMLFADYHCRQENEKRKLRLVIARHEAEDLFRKCGSFEGYRKLEAMPKPRKNALEVVYTLGGLACLIIVSIGWLP